MADRIPVTVLTGFLGAGKTTLLNRILSEPHGRKYAVIINEFGEVGIDNDIVAQKVEGFDEEIFEMNNGCICCTVRGDLIRIIGGLLKRGKNFDGIIVETTGLADPGPVIQSFFVDDTLKARTQLDAVVTLVDAQNVVTRLGDTKEAAEQVAFADILVLNKADLVDESTLDSVAARLRGINAFAPIIVSERSNVKLDKILNVGAFDLDRVTAREPDFLEHGHHHDHNEDIASFSFTTAKPINPMLFDAWIGELIQTKGPDLLRYKGILDIQGDNRRMVLQGVHMMLEGQPGKPWQADEKRESRLVFIGRNLDEAALRAGFEACTTAAVA
ncbi:MAG: GTP-binding protein [Bdellovibrionales bacterium]